MFIYLQRSIVILTALLGLISCTSSSLVQSNLLAEGNSHEKSLERHTLQLVNNYRKQNGLPPLQHHAGLTQIARGHSNFMASNNNNFKLEGKKISHYGFQSRSRYAQERHGLGSVAENVAAGWGTGQKGVRGALKGWKNSPGHNRTMLGKQWEVSGVGIRADENGELWFTQLFAVKQPHLPRGVGPLRTF